ncbi:hypothetical protein DEO72_LG8g2304 [Vigna unguiculata]|uniref:Uncharacterized protein n=1 Tax=Vigna unguiculata TaxID=3917 RepID=A0A4D6MVZ8_VIGUN|nr:hypothetical protein DEO72_LG8g2304 [Vigna unguiculata]
MWCFQCSMTLIPLKYVINEATLGKHFNVYWGRFGMRMKKRSCIGSSFGGRHLVRLVASQRFERVNKPLKRWKKALSEVAQTTLSYVDSKGRDESVIADWISFPVKQLMERLCMGAEIPFREMEIDDKIDFIVKHWAVIFRKPYPSSILTYIQVETADAIEFQVKHCREALFEAVGISRGAILNSCREIEITKAIELQLKYWKDAFSEEAGGVLDSKGFGMRVIDSEIWKLRNHWREKIHEAYGISEDKRQYSKEIEIEADLERWMKVLIEAANVATDAVYVSCIKMLKAYNRIETFAKHWRIALCDAVGISSFEVQHRRVMKDDEINDIEKHRDALREAAAISGVGTKYIEGLSLKLPRSNTKSLSTKAFMNMKKLRLMQLSGVELVGDFEYLSKDLRWLCWHGFPFAFIPTNFYQGSLVSIELENSKITMVLMQLSGVELVGDFEYLSKDLRWLCWHGFPFAFIPTNFYQGSLVSIELENSKITMVWKATQPEIGSSLNSPDQSKSSDFSSNDWKPR